MFGYFKKGNGGAIKISASNHDRKLEKFKIVLKEPFLKLKNKN